MANGGLGARTPNAYEAFSLDEHRQVVGVHHQWRFFYPSITCLTKRCELFEWHTAVKKGSLSDKRETFREIRDQKFEKKEESEMRDEMMLGEKEFLKAVLAILVLLVTLVCLHSFVLNADAATKTKFLTNKTSVCNENLVQVRDTQTPIHEFTIT